MVPMPKEEKMDSDGLKFFRESPFNIIYRIVEKRGEGNRGTEGAIVSNAFRMVIPRIILGGKKEDINADDILASRMSITPERPYIIPDVATSLLAIFLADFGLFGVFIPPLIILASLTIFFIPRRRPVSSPLLVLFWFSALVNLAGNVEGSLVAVLSTFRDAIIRLIAIVPISVLLYVIRVNLNSGARVNIRSKNIKESTL